MGVRLTRVRHQIRAIDDCHQHISKLAPTIRSATGRVAVSYARPMHLVFHDTTCASVTRCGTRSACSSDRGPILRDECFGIVQFIEPTSDVSVALPIANETFRLRPLRFSQEHFHTFLVKEKRFRTPKRLPSIDLSEWVERVETRSFHRRDKPFCEGSSPNALLPISITKRRRDFGRRRSCDFATATRRPTSVHPNLNFRSFGVWISA